jgi:hypothetical protein
MAIADQAACQFSANIAKTDKSDFHDCTQLIYSRQYAPFGKVRAPSMRGHN